MSAHNLDKTNEAEMTALFANLILQQSNMAMLLLGKLQTPDGSEAPNDPDAARFIIDQLAMLEHKTQGNLTREESDLLKQTLMVLRMTYVEVTEKRGPSAEGTEQKASAPEPQKQTAPEASSDAAQEEARKKFTKKY